MTNQFEKTTEQLQADVTLMEKLDRLHLNPDFVELISEGYLKGEAARLTDLMGSFAANGLAHRLVPPGMDSAINYAEKLRSDCLRALEGISSFRTYLNVIAARGEQSQNTLEQMREEETKTIENQED